MNDSVSAHPASGPTWAQQVPAHLTDGDIGNQSHPLASSGTLGFFYEIDLGITRKLSSLELVNRSNCCPERLSNYRVEVRADDEGSAGAVNWSATVRADGSNSGMGGIDVLPASLDPGGTLSGRFIRIINQNNAAYSLQIAEVRVFEAPLLVINFFSVDHGNITATGNPDLPSSATLSWSVTNADTVTINQEIGTVNLTGQQAISPTSTTTYLLTATNESGSVTRTVTVGVDEPILPPLITEFLADNANSLNDQFGESPDWIEIHNPNPFDLSLGGYHLTDRMNRPTQWTFPMGALARRAKLVRVE